MELGILFQNLNGFPLIPDGYSFTQIKNNF